MPRPVLFFVLQCIGILGTVWAVAVGSSLGWWGLVLVVYFVTSCLGMAVTVHRCLTHAAFSMPMPVARVLSLAAALGGTGSPLGWIAIHRAHHATADTPDDPHAPGHAGWALLLRGAAPRVEWWRVRDILRDPFQRRLHNHYLLILLGWALFLVILGPKWLIFGFLIPASLQITVTNLSTILAHGWGYRNFDTRDQSTNNFLIAALTWGEGWHNNHHARPRHWTLSHRHWEIDPAAWVIRVMLFLGLIRRGSLYEA